MKAGPLEVQNSARPNFIAADNSQHTSLACPSSVYILIYRVFSGQKRLGKQFTMADTDEAAIHLPNSSHDSAPQIETDLSDETQDFRFLNNLAL